MDDYYDDDYSEELHLDRKRGEGWTLCESCGDWLHTEDFQNGVGFCSCPEEQEETE